MSCIAIVPLVVDRQGTTSPKPLISSLPPSPQVKTAPHCLQARSPAASFLVRHRGRCGGAFDDPDARSWQASFPALTWSQITPVSIGLRRPSNRCGESSVAPCGRVLTVLSYRGALVKQALGEANAGIGRTGDNPGKCGRQTGAGAPCEVAVTGVTRILSVNCFLAILYPRIFPRMPRFPDVRSCSVFFHQTITNKRLYQPCPWFVASGYRVNAPSASWTSQPMP